MHSFVLVNALFMGFGMEFYATDNSKANTAVNKELDPYREKCFLSGGSKIGF